MTSRGSDSDPPRALGTTTEPPDRPSSDAAAETPAPTAPLLASAATAPAPVASARPKRSTLAERLAARMDAISAGQIDDDDDQLDGVASIDVDVELDGSESDFSVGDSTMTLDVSDAEPSAVTPLHAMMPPPRRLSTPIVPPPASPKRAIAIPVVTVPAKTSGGPPSSPKAPPPVPRIGTPMVARVPVSADQAADRLVNHIADRSVATIPPPLRRRSTMSQPALAIPDNVPVVQPPHIPADAPAFDDGSAIEAADEFLAIDSAIDLIPLADPVADLTLEAQLDSPSVLDMAMAELNEQGLEARAALFEKQVSAEVDGPNPDHANAAALAYESGFWYQHVLEDEARAVKAYGRALALDPSLRPNLWAIRAIFYRRSLWPNLLKLIEAELGYARDDRERADLHVEQADILLRAGANDAVAQARNALESALLYDAKHITALMVLERLISAQFDPSNADEAERLGSLHTTLAEVATLPERQQASWLRVAELSATNDPLRAADALEHATSLVALCGNGEAVAQCAIAVAARRSDPDADEAMLAALEQFAAVLEMRVGSGAVELGELNPRETMLRREIAAVYRRIAQLTRGVDASHSEAAWAMLQRGMAHVPGDALFIADLTELAEELGKYDELASLVATATASEADPARLLALRLRRADALLRGGRHHDATAVIEQLQTTDGGSLAVVSLLERAAVADGSRRGLATAWRALAEAFELGTWSAGITPESKNPEAAALAYVAAAQISDESSADGDDSNAGAGNASAGNAGEESRNLLSKARELAPNSSLVWEATLDDLERHGGHRTALALLGFAEPGQPAMAALVPWPPEVRYRYATMIAVAQRDGAMALAIETEWAQTHPEDIEARWRVDALAVAIGADAQRGPALVALAAHELSEELQGIAFAEAARAFERVAWQTVDQAQAAAWQQAINAYRQAAERLPDDPAISAGLLAALRATDDRSALADLQLAQARRLPDGVAAHAAYREAALLSQNPLAVAGEWLARFPEHVPAMVEVARFAAAANDWTGAATSWRMAQQSAIGRSAAGDVVTHGSAAAALLFADASERSDVLADAAEGYAAALAAAPDDDGELKAFAALAGGDFAPQPAFTDALIAGAGRSRFAAELAEHTGWQFLAVGEPTQAATYFTQAEQIDSARTGPLLGLALVAAIDHNADQVVHWHQKLAEHATDPAVAAALYVRAATAQFVAGDIAAAYRLADQAHLRCNEDRLAVELAAQLAQRNATDAVSASQYYAAAGAGAPTARLYWQIEQVDALMDAGQLRAAAVIIADLVGQTPTDIRVLRANLRLAQLGGNLLMAAAVHIALGKQLADAANQLAQFRAAVAIVDNPAPGGQAGRNRELAIAAYLRILEIEPGADEFGALRTLLQTEGSSARLDIVLARRIAYLIGQLEEPDATPTHQNHVTQLIASLYFQRATLGLGGEAGTTPDRERACLDHVLYYQPNHIDACWRRGEIALAAGEIQVALSLWRRCVANATGPAVARYELELARVLEESANDVSGAIEQLNHVVARTPSDMALRERLLALATRGQAWEVAAAQLRELAQRRSNRADKARDDHRLGQMFRDKLHDKLSARRAFDRARVNDPLNLDVVRDLAELLDGPAKVEVLGAAADDARCAVLADPTAASAYDRLAMIYSWQSDVDARFMALAAVEAVGVPTPDQRLVLKNGRAQVASLDWKRLMQRRMSPAMAAGLRSQEYATATACHDFWRAIGTTVTAVQGLEPSKFGFTRSDRVAQKKLTDKYAALSATLHFFGIEGAEIYLSETRAGVARTLTTDDGTLCLGADIATGATPAARYQLARTVALLAERLSTIAELKDLDLVSYYVASLRSADAPVPPELATLVRSDETVVAERARAMRKMSRKDRATVVALAARGNELAALRGYRQGVLALAHRAGLLWAGDIAVALEMLDVGRGARAIADNAIAQDLLAWSVSVEHRQSRDELGLARGGGAQ